MNWFSRKKRDSNLEPMQGQSREEANSGLDEAQRAREQLALESMRSLTESLRRMKSAEDRAEYSTSGTKCTIHSQIRNVQDTEGDIYTNRHDSPD